MPSLLIATRNSHKTDEFRAMLGADWKVADLISHPELPSPEETGETFAENAAIKALAASAGYPGLVLADDSGLEVDALNGEPGVRSARYAGEGATDGENRSKLLKALEEKGAEGNVRTARFRCAIAVCQRGELLGRFEGAVEGAIRSSPSGDGGFGYDSLFVPRGHQETFAELPEAAKNQLSHRGQALARFVAGLQDMMQSREVQPMTQPDKAH